MAPHLLFIGDSLIQFFDWQKRFPAYQITNLGVAGESVQGLLARIPALNERMEAPDWLATSLLALLPVWKWILWTP